MQKGKTAQGSEGTGDSAYDKGASAFDAKANEAKTTDSTPLPENPNVLDVEVLSERVLNCEMFLIQTVVKGLASEERIADNSSRTPLRSCRAVQGTEQAALRSAGSHSGSDVRKNAGAYFIWLICIFTFFRG